MRTPTSLLLLFTILVAAGCASPTRPGAVAWGEYQATSYQPIDEIEAVALAPSQGAEPDPEVEAALGRSLDRRGIAVAPDAPLRLRYRLHAVPSDAEDEGLGILLGGSAGSSGSNDVGVGLDLPLLGGDRTVRQTAYRMELSLEDAAGTLLWRGRARGNARVAEPGALARPVAPLLLEWLGKDRPPRSFSR